MYTFAFGILKMNKLQNPALVLISNLFCLITDQFSLDILMKVVFLKIPNLRFFQFLSGNRIKKFRSEILFSYFLNYWLKVHLNEGEVRYSELRATRIPGDHDLYVELKPSKYFPVVHRVRTKNLLQSRCVSLVEMLIAQ